MKADLADLNHDEARAFLRFLLMEKKRHLDDIGQIQKDINVVCYNFKLNPDDIDIWEFVTVQHDSFNPRREL